MELDLARELSKENDSKIVLFVMDGLGGLPHPETGRTEMETAYTPHLDRIAKESACGFTIPVAPGVTPGSGPGHLALFGYDPLAFNVGRGVLEAIGVDFDLQPSDVAARGNFCTVDADGRIIGIEILSASKVLAPGDWQNARRPGETSSDAAE